MPKGWDYDNFQSSIRRNYNLLGNNVKSLYWGESKNSLAFTTFRRYTLRIEAGMDLALDPRFKVMDYDEFDHKAFNSKEIEAFFAKPVWSMHCLISLSFEANNTTDQVMLVAIVNSTIVRQSYPTDLWSLAYLYH